MIDGEQEVRDALRAYVGTRKQAHVAKELGVSESYFSQMLNGTRGISPEVGEKLGFTFSCGWSKIPLDKSSQICE